LGKWYVIVNPSSAFGTGLEQWKRIEPLLVRSDLSFQASVSRYPGHIVELAENAAREGFRRFVAVGGDGTVNELVNGLHKAGVLSECVVATIPVGRGTDWAKTLGLDASHERSVQAILTEKTRMLDAAVAVIQGEDGTHERIFVNVAGLGYDAFVTERANRKRRKQTKGSYLFELFKCLLKYQSTFVEVLIDGATFYQGKAFSIAVGNCRFNGGGMIPLPNADPQDGLLDVTVIGDVSKLDVLFNVYRVFNGSLLDYPKVVGFRGKEVLVNSSPSAMVEVDGEIVGWTPARFVVLPKAIRAIVAGWGECVRKIKK